MTPQELAARLSQLDWSGCSLQHQLAVAAAVETLGGGPPPRPPCEYCGNGKRTGLPGNACENCMNTGYADACAADLEERDVAGRLVTLPIGSNVVALVPKGAAAAQRTVRLLTLDGHQIGERQFPAGRADGPWSWIRSEVATLANCLPEAIGAAEADAADFVTVDGIPYCRVVLC